MLFNYQSLHDFYGIFYANSKVYELLHALFVQTYLSENLRSLQ